MNLERARPFSDAHVGRKIDGLPELVAEHTQTVKRLERCLAKYLKNHEKQRPTIHGADAIDLYLDRMRDLEARINKARSSINARHPTQYGFVTYPDASIAHSIASCNKSAGPALVRLAPQTADIIWNNLNLAPSVIDFRRFMGNVALFFLTIAWTVPNALIASFITNLNNLGLVWPAFQRTLNSAPKFWAIFQGVAGPLLVVGFFLLLPIILRRLSRWQGDMTKTSREKAVLHKLYFFFMLNSFVIFTLFGTMWAMIKQWVDQADAENGSTNWTEAIRTTDVLSNISYAITGNSAFWIMFFNQRIWSSMIDLVQLWRLVYQSIRKRFAPTPREQIYWTAPPKLDLALYLNFALFYTSITLVFAVIAPLIAPFVFVYFLTSYYVHKYGWMYVYDTKLQSAGSFWLPLFNRIIFASAFAQVLWFLVIWVWSFAQLCFSPSRFNIISWQLALCCPFRSLLSLSKSFAGTDLTRSFITFEPTLKTCHFAAT